MSTFPGRVRVVTGVLGKYRSNGYGIVQLVEHWIRIRIIIFFLIVRVNIDFTKLTLNFQTYLDSRYSDFSNSFFTVLHDWNC